MKMHEALPLQPLHIALKLVFIVGTSPTSLKHYHDTTYNKSITNQYNKWNNKTIHQKNLKKSENSCKVTPHRARNQAQALRKRARQHSN